METIQGEAKDGNIVGFMFELVVCSEPITKFDGRLGVAIIGIVIAYWNG